MKLKEAHAILAISPMSKSDLAMAARYGFVKEPAWGNKAPEVVKKKHDEMLPAANIKSGWSMNTESRSGNTRRMR